MKYQQVAGFAGYDKFSDNPDHMYVTSDLTEVYNGQVEKIERAVSLVDKKYVVIEDRIKAGSKFTMLTWSLVTPAEATLLSEKVMLLEMAGKKLYLKVEGPEEIKWQVTPAQSPFSYDSDNPGISVVRFDTDLVRNTEQTIRVYLLPGEDKPVNYKPVLF